MRVDIDQSRKGRLAIYLGMCMAHFVTFCLFVTSLSNGARFDVSLTTCKVFM